MLKRLQQIFDKFMFCLGVAATFRTFFLLLVNSKRFNRFQKHQVATAVQKQEKPVLYEISLKKEKHNIYLRTYAGDIRMFYEIFLDKVYQLPPSFTAVNGNIIDAGANIGMAALYFSACYPNAKIYCIEPAPGNFSLLQKNLSNKISKGTMAIFHAALYAEDGLISINEDGWAYNASVNKAGQTSVTAVTLSTFLEKNRLETVDLLKLDVEGAEAFIFRSDTSWLKKIKAILVEIHAAELVEEIKLLLLKEGFHWYKWQHNNTDGSIYLATKTVVDSAGE